MASPTRRDARRFERGIARLATDRTSSSTAIGSKLLDLILRERHGRSPADALEFGPRILAQLRTLTRAQPEMALLQGIADALRRAWMAGLSHGGPLVAAVGLRRSALGLHRTVRSAPRAIARKAMWLFRSGGRAVTLSNSSEVAEVLSAAHGDGRLSEVLVAESRPGSEGRVLARRLSSRGLRTRVVPDATIAVAVAWADLAIVGADAIDRTGAVVSKVGTYPMALACRAQHKPFYVTASDLKFVPRLHRVSRHPPLLAPTIADSHRSGMARREGTTLFERTPGRYVTRYLTDSGVFRTVALRRRR